MGLLDKAKGFLNVDGVKVHVTEVENPFPIDDTVMKGRFVLSAKSDKTVLSTAVEFYLEETTEKDGEKKTERTSLGRYSSKDVLAGNDEYPFLLKAGDLKEIPFILIDVNIEGMAGRMAQKGGLMGALGTAAKFASQLTRGERRYYVEAQADVKGTPFDPSDKVEIKVVPGKS